MRMSLASVWTTSTEIIQFSPSKLFPSVNACLQPNFLHLQPIQTGENVYFNEDHKINPPVYSEIPDLIRSKYATFAMTAFNPPGISRSSEDNKEANIKMYNNYLKNITFIEDIWPSFGFNIKEKWREDGFMIICKEEERGKCREKILTVASIFKQGAIFEYFPMVGNNYSLKRETIPTEEYRSSFADESMIVVNLDREQLLASIESIDTVAKGYIMDPWRGPDLSK